MFEPYSTNLRDEGSGTTDPPRTEEEGVAMLEFAIAVFGIVFGILIVIDLGLAISQYMLLSQAGQEGVRFMAQLPQFEPSPSGGYTDIGGTAVDIQNCIDGLPSAIACRHYFAQQRVREALQTIDQFDSFGVSGGLPQITTYYTPANSGTGSTDDTVAIELRGTYTGFFLNFPMLVDHQSAYLYEGV
ncbi:MAG: pilus assembly protein [Bdellovibrionales bacterium]|nr:pilus assembly protein [Bdellovibrionales bacterium]